MSKEAELNQFGEVGGMQPNELNQTDHCDDGGMKINDINQLILSEEGGVKARFSFFNVFITNILITMK